MKTVAVLCPTRRELRSLPAVATRHNFEVVFDQGAVGNYFSNFSFGSELDILDFVESRVRHYGKNGIDGIAAAVGFPGMTAASALIARKLSCPGPDPAAVLLCEHKYYARLEQKKLVPDATPDFTLIDPQAHDPASGVDEFPCFLKPVKSILSKGAYKVSSRQELRELAIKEHLPRGFLRPFNELVAELTNFEFDGRYLIAESLLAGDQVSLEGYVYNGQVIVMGIVDALMYPGSISFKRFQYPSALPLEIQNRMKDIAERFFKGIDYDNAPFNMELMYNPESGEIHIIEINAKLASQFPDLFEKVDGFNTYAALLALACGDEPVFENGKGEFALAASCVLRTWEDQLVQSVPTGAELERIRREYADALIEVFAEPEKRLSEQMQDSASYRYGLVNIGAQSEDKLEQKFEEIKRKLNFKFLPVSSC